MRILSSQITDSKIDEKQKTALRLRITPLFTELEGLRQRVANATEKYDRERIEYDRAKSDYDQRARECDAHNKVQTARYEAEKASAEHEYEMAFKHYQSAVCLSVSIAGTGSWWFVLICVV